MRWRTIEVPTEDARKCVLDFWEREQGVWCLAIAEDLIFQQPEMVAACITQALIEMRGQIDAQYDGEATP